MEPADQYYKVDNWPEQDRASFLRYVTEVPLFQDTVLTIMAIGLSKEYPLTCADALELVEQLVKRASALTFTLSIPVIRGSHFLLFIYYDCSEAVLQFLKKNMLQLINSN